MSWHEEQEMAAVARLTAMLDLPAITADGMFSDGERFDPWDMFPCLYGSYSSEFDELAIGVLTDIRDGTYNCDGLAAEMFREILCTSHLCDYGTSPRTCFPSPSFRPLLPLLIERWREYAAIQWQDDTKTTTLV